MSLGLIKFDEFVLDCDRYELLRDGRRLKLEKLPMELLILLVEKDGHLVTRQEIIDRLWGTAVFVDTEHSINTAVRKVRNVLRDDPGQPRFVQTVTGKGYRFIASLNGIHAGRNNGNRVPTDTGSSNTLVDRTAEQSDDAAAGPAIASTPPRDSRSSPASRLQRTGLLLTGMIVIAVVVIGLKAHNLRNRWLARASKPQIHSLAVLPLQNLSGDPGQEYFVDGTTEELITTLAQLTDLRVTSRTSVMQFKGVQKPIQEIARVLDVDAVVEGSIARSADTIRITVQLIDARADRHLWAGEYHSSLNDVLRQQEEIAHDVALQVSTKIAPEQERLLTAAKPVNPQAHDLYLRARQYAAEWNETAMLKAVELYQEAIRLQPDYAAAYVGLADAHSLFGTWGCQEAEGEWPHVREAAAKALSFDSSVPGAHEQLAWVKHIYDWDTSGAAEEFQEALKTDRGNAGTHMKYGLFLAQIGRVEEGLAEAQLAEELDPLSSRISGTEEKMFMIARRYDDVFKQAKRTRELYPDNYVTALHVSETYQLLGRYAEAIDELEAHPEPGAMTQEQAKVFARKLRTALRSQGPKGYWGALLRDRLDTQADDHCLLGYAYFRTGDFENGYRQLELAIKGRDRNLRQMKTHPMWDFVRDSARFQQILREVGF